MITQKRENWRPPSFFPSTKKKNLSLSSSSSSFRRRNSHAIVQYVEVVKQQQQTLRLWKERTRLQRAKKECSKRSARLSLILLSGKLLSWRDPYFTAFHLLFRVSNLTSTNFILTNVNPNSLPDKIKACSERSIKSVTLKQLEVILTEVIEREN